MSDFCSLEKTVKNPTTGKYKFADAFYDKTQTCIEFQHSYINWDFEERNKFYKELSIDTVWLFDLPNANVQKNENGNIEILENNSKGFFRIYYENPDNLKNHKVYIQVKSGDIYRVNELSRKNTLSKHTSTVMYFKLTEEYTEQEFINAIKDNKLVNVSQPKPIQELWNKNYLWMIVKNIEKDRLIRVNRNHQNEIFRDFKNNCIKYTFEDDIHESKQVGRRKKDYPLSHRDEYRPIWILVKAKSKSL